MRPRATLPGFLAASSPRDAAIPHIGVEHDRWHVAGSIAGRTANFAVVGPARMAVSKTP
jgi:hypothetical protein